MFDFKIILDASWEQKGKDVYGSAGSDHAAASLLTNYLGETKWKLDSSLDEQSYILNVGCEVGHPGLTTLSFQEAVKLQCLCALAAYRATLFDFYCVFYFHCGKRPKLLCNEGLMPLASRLFVKAELHKATEKKNPQNVKQLSSWVPLNLCTYADASPWE